MLEHFTFYKILNWDTSDIPILDERFGKVNLALHVIEVSFWNIIWFQDVYEYDVSYLRKIVAFAELNNEPITKVTRLHKQIGNEFVFHLRSSKLRKWKIENN